jgi:hypothetical protein
MARLAARSRKYKPLAKKEMVWSDVGVRNGAGAMIVTKMDVGETLEDLEKRWFLRY